MEGFIDALVNFWKYNFWLSTICTVVGVLVLAPLLLSKRLRNRTPKLYAEPELIGMSVLILAIIGFAIYNNLRSSGGT